MNAHDIALENRELLRRWKALLENREIVGELDEDGIIFNPKMQIQRPSNDMLTLLIEGIERALDGERDPFGIEEPRGIKPRLDRQQKIDTIAAILDEQEANPQKTLDEVFDFVGKKLKVSPVVVRNAFSEKNTKEWAEIQRKVRKNYKKT
jgi:hypothetical protein